MNMCLVFAIFLFSGCLQAQTGSVPPRPPVPLPQIKQSGGVKQMFVDGKPFIMLAGELHNSSASGLEYMKPVWRKLEALHVNTVVGTVNWELTAQDEFLFIGSNLRPTFEVDAAGTRVVIASKDEGRYEKGKWIPDRRLNGDEARRGLPNGTYTESAWKLLAEGTAIGDRKIDRFPKITVRKVRLTIVKAEPYAAIRKFSVYLEEGR